MLLCAALAAICLFTPFVWLQIGPEGYKNYGPNVPDVYIFGANISGKDLRFDGINFAYKFQRAAIVYYIISSSFASLILHHPKATKVISVFNLLLLLLFPLWLVAYTHGVVDNSDGADMTIHPQIGILVYLVMLLAHVFMVFVLSKNRE